MTTQEQYEQAKGELKQVEEALKAARAALATAQAEKDKINQFYNGFLARWNEYKKHFAYLPLDALGEWAVKNNNFELERKAIDRRFSEYDQLVARLTEEVRVTDAARAERVIELQYMRMPDGKAWHLRGQENRMRGG